MKFNNNNILRLKYTEFYTSYDILEIGISINILQILKHGGVTKFILSLQA